MQVALDLRVHQDKLVHKDNLVHRDLRDTKETLELRDHKV